MELYSAWSFVVIHGAVKCVVVNSHNLMIVPNPTTQREGKGGKGGVGVSGRESGGGGYTNSTAMVDLQYKSGGG